MKKNQWLTVLTIMLTLGIVTAQAIKVHTIGDSTMANYDENSTITRGWCMYLQQFLNPDSVTVVNYGKGGADSKGFYRDAARWPAVKKQLKAGDYVLIQFAHNDEKNGGVDGDSLKAYYLSKGDRTSANAVDLRGTTPSGTYKKALINYVNDTRAAGCNPVLVAPICRMYFGSNGKIRRNGRHDLGDSFSVLTADGLKENQSVPASDHSMDYTYQMKQVADSMNVPFIDLTTATADLFESYGDARCHELLSDGNGSTHLNTTGATLIARLCAERMKAQGILANDVQISSDISVSPTSADLGKSYVGQTLTKEFSLSAFGLTPESGTINITANNGVKVSTDQQNWDESTSIDYTDGTIVKSFYAQLTLSASGVTNSTINVTCGDKTIEIPVTAEAISLEGGEEVKAYWRLEKDSTFTLTGPANVLPEEFSGMYVQRYANPNKNAKWPDYTGFDASRKMQRNLIIGDVWPDGDIDENPDRYIQFGITPSTGTTLNIDSIGLFICGAGGNGMQCHVNYSTEPNFANQHTFYAPAKMVANNIEAATVQPVIELHEGDTLRVRVYPWYNGSAKSKTICISDVLIHGMAMSATGITNVKNGEALKDEVWYNLQGQRIATPRHGIFIRNGKKYIIK